MKQYFLNLPFTYALGDIEITEFVTKEPQAIEELAFELDRVTVPSNMDLSVDNSTGRFEYNGGFFTSEITDYILIVREDGRDLYVGLLADIEIKENIATLKAQSALAKIIQQSVPIGVTPYTFTGTPSALIKDLLTNQSILPGLFIDGITFDELDTAEAARGINLTVNIPATDKKPFSEIIQTIYGITGDYLFSNRGILSIKRMGFVSDQGYDYKFTEAQLIAGKSQRSRPILWQKTRVVLPLPAGGKIARNMADHYPQEGPSILEKYSEKTLENDVLGGTIYHTNTTSATESAQDILGWRGFVRFDEKYQLDISDEINRSALNAIPLLSRVLVEHRAGSILGVLIEKRVFEDRAEIRVLSISDPVVDLPETRLSPFIANSYGYAVINSQFTFRVEYYLQGDPVTQTTVGPDTAPIVIDNASQLPLWVRYERTGRFSQWRRVDHVNQSMFIAEVNLIGDVL